MDVLRRILIAALLLLAVGCSHPIPTYESHYTPPASALDIAPKRPQFDPATIGRALESDQPYTISVIGDSTGNYVDEWVYRLMHHIADAYGRTVTIHDWDTSTNASYTSQHTFGSGPPVTVWNGSASGKSAQFSLAHFADLEPEPVNLTIISHGHNNPAEAVDGVEQLVDQAYAHTLPGGGVVVVLQNKRIDPDAEPRAEAIERLRQAFSNPNTGVFLMDINAAFKDRPDLPALLRPDGVHPNAAGEQVWADAAAQDLQLR